MPQTYDVVSEFPLFQALLPLLITDAYIHIYIYIERLYITYDV